jgi:hypothetical protein
MPLTENEAAQKAMDLAEAVNVIIEVIGMDNVDRVLIAKYFLDDLIGTDETAVIEALPFMTPELTETITDLIIPLIADAVIKKLTPPAVP